MDVANNEDMQMILIPFKENCSSEKEVIDIINHVFLDIEHGTELTDFSIVKRNKKKCWSSYCCSVIHYNLILADSSCIKKLLKLD